MLHKTFFCKKWGGGSDASAVPFIFTFIRPNDTKFGQLWAIVS